MPQQHTEKSSIWLAEGRTSTELLPRRGGLIARLCVDGVEILYLDKTTLQSPNGKIRGGIPLCWPVAGPGTGFAGGELPMPQHGVFRGESLEVTSVAAKSATLRLASNERTRAMFPFNFEIIYTICLIGNGIKCSLSMCNLGGVAFPVSPGWHPYFLCPAARKSELTSPILGNTGLDNVSNFDFGLPSPAGGNASFDIPTVGRVSLRFSPSIRHLQFWSLSDRDFVCIEPFMHPPGTFGSPQCEVLHAGAKMSLHFQIRRSCGDSKSIGAL
jgi:galactose mutarotase-like enzyme